MYRIGLLILILGGFFSSGCTSIMEAGKEGTKKWWAEEGFYKVQDLVASGVEKGAAETLKAAENYTNRKVAESETTLRAAGIDPEKIRGNFEAFASATTKEIVAAKTEGRPISWGLIIALFIVFLSAYTVGSFGKGILRKVKEWREKLKGVAGTNTPGA